MSNPDKMYQYRAKHRNRSRIYIYALADPENDEIRYVGQTSMPKTRLSGHINEAKNGAGNRAKSLWINGLIQRGSKPQIIILEEVLPELANDREEYWFNQLSKQYHLLNEVKAVGRYGYGWKDHHVRRSQNDIG